MSSMDSINNIKKLISKGKLREAIILLKHVTLNSDLYDEVINQAAKLEQYELEKRQGTVSYENLNIIFNQINTALISIANRLLNSMNEKNDNFKKDSYFKRKKLEGIKKKKLWLYIATLIIIIVIVGGCALIYANINNLFADEKTSTYSVTVQVHGKKGKDDKVLPNRGIVYLIYGDAKIPGQINDKGITTFNQISKDFFTSDARVELSFEDPEGEPYRVANRDTLYRLEMGQLIYLQVMLEGIDMIHGVVKDFETGKVIDSATVRIFGKEVYSNQYGEFILDIPEKQQNQFVKIRAFKKGFQNWELANVPTTTEQEIIIPMKKEN